MYDPCIALSAPPRSRDILVPQELQLVPRLPHARSPAEHVDGARSWWVAIELDHPTQGTFAIMAPQGVLLLVVKGALSGAYPKLLGGTDDVGGKVWRPTGRSIY